MERNRLIVLALLLSIYSFKQVPAQTESLIGRYICDSSIGTRIDLKLLENESFVYITLDGMVNDTVRGEWCVERKKVTLIPTKTKAYHISKPCDSCENKPFIRTFDELGEELMLPGVTLYKGGDLIQQGFADSLDFSTMSFDSLKVDMVAHQSYWLVPEDTSGLIYEVYLRSEAAERMERKSLLKVKKKNLVTESGLVLKRQL